MTAAVIASVAICHAGREKQAPTPVSQAAQDPPPHPFGNKPRRIISLLIGPGGQATDQPRTNAVGENGNGHAILTLDGAPQWQKPSNPGGAQSDRMNGLC